VEISDNITIFNVETGCTLGACLRRKAWAPQVGIIHFVFPKPEVGFGFPEMGEIF